MLSRRLDASQMISLYRNMKSRYLNSDQWDRQLKFWSDLIKRLGREACVIDFNVDEPTKALMYGDLYPPLGSSLAYLVTMKVLRARRDCISQPSVLSRVIGFVFRCDPEPSDFYVFQAHLTEQAQRVCEDIVADAAMPMNLCVTRDALALACPGADMELLTAELRAMRGRVEEFDGGFYISAPGVNKLPWKLISCVLTSRNTMGQIDREIERTEARVEAAVERARAYQRSGRRQQALECVARKRAAEDRIARLHRMRDRLEGQLHTIESGVIGQLALETFKTFKAMLAGPSVEEVEDLVEEVRGTRHEGEAIAEAIAGPEIDDAEHSLEMQYPLIKWIFGDRPIKLVPILVGSLSEERQDRIEPILAPLILGERSLFVISSDFTHQGKMFRFTANANMPKPLEDQPRLWDEKAFTIIATFSSMHFRFFLAEIRAVRGACPYLKVIIETCYLSREQIIDASMLTLAAADCVKTSTGVGPEGATTENVAIMREVVGPRFGVKAAGGVRTREAARAVNL